MTIDLSPEAGPVRSIMVNIKELGSVLMKLLIFIRFYERSGPQVLQSMLRYTKDILSN